MTLYSEFLVLRHQQSKKSMDFPKLWTLSAPSDLATSSG